MAKKMGPLDIANMMGAAANKKSQLAGQNQMPNDEEDPKNSSMPTAKKAPQSVKSKQVAAMSEQGEGKGKMAPLNKQSGKIR